jgi:hypothetical protein
VAALLQCAPGEIDHPQIGERTIWNGKSGDIMFADIVGFTRLSAETTTAVELTELLNGCLSVSKRFSVAWAEDSHHR